MTTFQASARRAITAMVLLFSAATSMAAQWEPGCEDIRIQNPRIQKGAQVQLTIDAIGTLQPPPGLTKEQFAKDLIADASNELNLRNIDGVRFLFDVSGAPPSEARVQLGVRFGGAGSGDAVAQLRPFSTGTTLDTAVVAIFTDKNDCDGGVLCYDPGKPRYAEAIKEMLLHEIFHALGASDSQRQNVMLGFVGVNNAGNPNPALDCIANRLNTLRYTYPGGQPGCRAQ